MSDLSDALIMVDQQIEKARRRLKAGYAVMKNVREQIEVLEAKIVELEKIKRDTIKKHS